MADETELTITRKRRGRYREYMRHSNPYKFPGKNFRITPYINYAFCVINYASALLSSKTMVNSPEYCIYTSVINTYCVIKRGFQFLSFFHPFLPVSLSFSPLIHLPLCPVSHGFLFPFFFGSRRDLNQRFTVALAYLSLCHTTRPRRFVEIPWSKNWYLFACSSSNIHNKRTEMCIHVNYSRFCL